MGQTSDDAFVPGNLHECHVEFSRSAAQFFNQRAEDASSGTVLDDEHVSFPEKEMSYVMFALPGAVASKETFIEEFQKLSVRVDGDQIIELKEYPRLFSYHIKNKGEVIRGTPVLVPLSVLGEDFVGQAHDVELIREHTKIFGPKRWLVPDERSGPVVTKVEGGPGPGEVTFHFNKIDFTSMSIVFYADARFGDPINVIQITPDNRRKALSFHQAGIDMVGDQFLFSEWYVEGFEPGYSTQFDVRMKFTHSGSGYFSAVGQLYTRHEANRTVNVP